MLFKLFVTLNVLGLVFAISEFRELREAAGLDQVHLGMCIVYGSNLGLLLAFISAKISSIPRSH